MKLAGARAVHFEYDIIPYQAKSRLAATSTSRECVSHGFLA